MDALRGAIRDKPLRSCRSYDEKFGSEFSGAAESS
jgi:hypothetical protein